MLPVNIDGVTWLTTNYTTYNTPIIVGVISYVLLVLSFCVALIATFFWFSFKEKCLTLYLIATVVCCMISFLAIYHDEKKNQEDYYFSWFYRMKMNDALKQNDYFILILICN